MTSKEAEKRLIEAWKIYDRTKGEDKVLRLIDVFDLAIDYERQGLVSITVASYWICHSSLADFKPEGSEIIFDEACDLELGEDFIDKKELTDRWAHLVKSVEKLKKGYGLV